KLLCFKLRTTHKALLQLNDINHPPIWLKILRLLYLCQTAAGTPQEKYSLFMENIGSFLSLSRQQQRIALERLLKAQIIHTEGQQLQVIQPKRLQLFITLGSEEFANEEIKVPTPSKAYQAALFIE